MPHTDDRDDMAWHCPGTRLIWWVSRRPTAAATSASWCARSRYKRQHRSCSWSWSVQRKAEGCTLGSGHFHQHWMWSLLAGAGRRPCAGCEQSTSSGRRKHDTFPRNAGGGSDCVSDTADACAPALACATIESGAGTVSVQVHGTEPVQAYTVSVLGVHGQCRPMSVCRDCVSAGLQGQTALRRVPVRCEHGKLSVYKPVFQVKWFVDAPRALSYALKRSDGRPRRVPEDGSATRWSRGAETAQMSCVEAWRCSQEVKNGSKHLPHT